jgi:hypothetical protein
MAIRDDRIDRTALTFVVLVAIFLFALAYTIFPRHEEGGASAPASSSAPSSSAPSPEKK